MTVTSAELLAAETLSDALTAALNDAQYSAVAERMLARYKGAPPEVSIPLREAATELGVSLPTVRDWISRGLLLEVDRQPRSVSIPSLALLLAAQAAGAVLDSPRPTAKLLDQLRDQHLLAWAHRVALTTDPGSYIVYSDEDLAELERM